jgi:hypothetical protein
LLNKAFIEQGIKRKREERKKKNYKKSVPPHVDFISKRKIGLSLCIYT